MRSDRGQRFGDSGASASLALESSRPLGRVHVVVGNMLFFDLNDTMAALHKITDQLGDLHTDLISDLAKKTPAHVPAFAQSFDPIAFAREAMLANPAQATWYQQAFLPALDDYRKVLIRLAEIAPVIIPGLSGNARGDWALVELWDKRVRDLRADARAHGFALASAEPPPLPKTDFDHAKDAIEKAGNTGLYIALGLGGAFLLSLLPRGAG